MKNEKKKKGEATQLIKKKKTAWSYNNPLFLHSNSPMAEKQTSEGRTRTVSVCYTNKGIIEMRGIGVDKKGTTKAIGRDGEKNFKKINKEMRHYKKPPINLWTWSNQGKVAFQNLRYSFSFCFMFFASFNPAESSPWQIFKLLQCNRWCISTFNQRINSNYCTVLVSMIQRFISHS